MEGPSRTAVLVDRRKGLDELGDIHKVAALGIDYDLEFEAGTAFQYSDQGTDMLTAVIERVSGMPAAEFRRIALITAPLTCRRLLRQIGARHEPLSLAPASPPPQKTLHFA